MSQLISRCSRRYISIYQTSVISAGSSVSSASDDTLQSAQAETLPVTNSNEPQFQVLGTPPSILSVSLAPSVPVYIKKGSLLSLYSGVQDTNLDESVSSQWEMVSPLKSFLYGGFATNYQRLVSTIPYSVLISSVAKNFWNKRQASQRSIVSVLLDGRIDWAVLPKSALQAYSGTSLSITIEQIPRTISAKLSKLLDIPRSTYTGLFKWTKAGFTFVSGRGQVALTGDGQIYRIVLKENEEFLVNRKNILAISVNGESDLANCVASHILSGTLKASPPPQEVNKDVATGVLPLLRRFIKSTMKLSSRTSKSAYNFMIGNNGYVKIVGPRNVLVQTNTNSQLSNALRSFNFKDNEIERTELKIKKSEELIEPEKTGSAYLKIATVSNGKVEFKSTENFQESVKKIEEAGKKI